MPLRVENNPMSLAATYGEHKLGDMIEVDMGSFETSKLPMVSTGYANCIAIVGLARRMALLGHFQDISEPGAGGSELFNKAVATLARMEAHDILLAGGGMSNDPAHIELPTADRAFAERAVRETLPEAKVTIKWNAHPGTFKDVVVFPESGRAVIHDNPFRLMGTAEALQFLSQYRSGNIDT